MTGKLLTITTEGTGKGKAARKGRSFAVAERARVHCDSLWRSGTSSNVRPVFLSYAASERACRPFTANLRSGRIAADGNTMAAAQIECMRSADYVWPQPQRIPSHVPGGTPALVQTVYLPELFDLDPGMIDPQGVRFVSMPPLSVMRDGVQTLTEDERRDLIMTASRTGYLSRESGAASTLSNLRIPLLHCPFTPLPAERHLEAPDKRILLTVPEVFCIAVIAAHVCARLDRRTRCPLLPDLSYRFVLLLRALRDGLASLPVDGENTDYLRRQGGWRGSLRHAHDFQAAGVREMGCCTPIAWRSPHKDLDLFLAEQVQEYMRTR